MNVRLKSILTDKDGIQLQVEAPNLGIQFTFLKYSSSAICNTQKNKRLADMIEDFLQETRIGEIEVVVYPKISAIAPDASI